MKRPVGNRLETGQQDAILPHSGSYSFHIGSETPGDLRRSETRLDNEAGASSQQERCKCLHETLLLPCAEAMKIRMNSKEE
jgi:hypothetical protein